MAFGTLAPTGKQYFWNIVTGEPLAGGFVYTYIAGTSTPIATYQDSALTSLNTNPIQLSNAGYCTIYLPIGVSIKEVVVDANGVAQWTQDGIASVPSSASSIDVPATAGENIAALAPAYLSDGSGGKTAGLWYNGDSANAYSSTLPPAGIAIAAIAIGASGTIRVAGQLSGFTGLTLADQYIGLAGTLTTTAPSNARVIGRADSTTDLIIGGPAGSSAGGLDYCQLQVFAV